MKVSNSRLRHFGLFAVALTVLSVAGWYAPAGQNLQCALNLRSGLTFEMPETGELTFAEYEELIHERTEGCGRLRLHPGEEIDPDAVVTCCGDVRADITTANRSVFVSIDPTAGCRSWPDEEIC